MLNYEFPPLGGGAGNATYYLLKEFSKIDDMELDLITSSISDAKTYRFSDNITIHFLNIGKKGNIHYQTNKNLLTYSYKAYQYSKKIIKLNRHNLVHAFFGIPCGYLAYRLNKKYKIPYIVSLRGSDVPFYNKRFYWLDKLFFKNLSKKIWRNAYKVVANSEGLANLAKKSSPKQDISIIPNGVDTKHFAPKSRVKKLQSDKLRLISTGRLIERKGYQFLIPALKDLPVILYLVGSGNIKAYLEDLSKRYNVQVEFIGAKEHSEVASYLQESDIFVLPSLNEGMSNSVLEAMACGLPVIVTNVGGSEELIDGNGFIVKKADIESLRNAIVKYEKNPELIKEHGEKSRQLAEKMSWEKVAEQYKEIYDELA